MIEILPNEEFWRGSYEVPSVVDEKTYLYLYNEIFTEEWRQYIEKKNADPAFLKSKWLKEESQLKKDIKLNSLSYSEKIKAAERFKEFVDFRRCKKGKRFQRLVEEFDRVRSLITLYNGKFYIYTIQNSYADFISVYMLEKIDITKISNSLYLTLNKRTRILMRESLLMDFEQID